MHLTYHNGDDCTVHRVADVCGAAEFHRDYPCVELARERLQSGYYERVEVIDAVVDQLMDELDGA